MLRVVPKSFFSWSVDVYNGDEFLVSIDVSWFREAGTFSLDGYNYKLYRTSILRGTFVLEEDGEAVARAVKPSAFHRRLEVGFGGETLELKAASVFGRRFVLSKGKQALGEIRPKGLFTRKAAVTFSDDLPLTLRIYLIWLVLILWRRAAQNSQ